MTGSIRGAVSTDLHTVVCCVVNTETLMQADSRKEMPSPRHQTRPRVEA